MTEQCGGNYYFPFLMVPVIPVAHELTDTVMRKHFLKSLWHDFVTFINLHNLYLLSIVL